MNSKLTRRDFINGVAVGAAGLHLSPLEALAQGLLPSHSLDPDTTHPRSPECEAVSMAPTRSLMLWHDRVERSRGESRPAC